MSLLGVDLESIDKTYKKIVYSIENKFIKLYENLAKKQIKVFNFFMPTTKEGIFF